jgi:hypothetical protein
LPAGAAVAGAAVAGACVATGAGVAPPPQAVRSMENATRSDTTNSERFILGFITFLQIDL